ncbi:CPBP family intramembrane glutamic endopeptidase [Solicola gregarius]|uniref:CPBP family intramembrane metalloprotease n=1 Tax=Solicola gregarius TaxID=2908642 RepID=A0AA46TGY0_9ACTN|nr:CPBP family intramembrane glutamic endopeptidase [Solicola gregarius]UYM04607.1 CPBP family intramembrane metalloprotease [Solicola gregarius]
MKPARRALRRIGDRLPRSLSHVASTVIADDARGRARRRRVVAGTTAVGAGLLGTALSARPGSPRFYRLSWATAGAWTVGGVLSGPLRRGWIEHRDDRLRRPVLVPVATGGAAFGAFYGFALAAQRIPVLRRAIAHVLRHADSTGDARLLTMVCANAVAEEVFFRGAVYPSVAEHHPVAASTALYTLATVPTRNPALIAAAGFMGALFALQRRASGGVQAPALTHLTWSILMVRFMPPLFRDDPPATPTSAERSGR